jgi:hypothetical protein
MPANLPYRVPTIRRYAVTETLAPIADRYNPLGVSVPCNVIYAARDNVIFTWMICQRTNINPGSRNLLTLGVDCLYGVPNTD